MSNPPRKTGLPSLRTQDAQINRWADGVQEQLEVLHGARGDPLNRALTLRDLQAIGFNVDVLMANSRGSSITVRPGGAAAAAAPLVDAAAKKAIERADMDAFAKAITETALFKDLMAPLKWQDVRDPSRFNWVPEQLRRELLTSIAEEASRRGTDITKVETIVKDGAARFARQLQEITAAMGEAAAGVRELSFAYADADRAVAGKITQLEAAVGINMGLLEEDLHVWVDKDSATAGKVTNLISRVGSGTASLQDELKTWVDKDSATAKNTTTLQARLDTGDFSQVKIESSATAKKVGEVSAQYTVKVQAGGAIAGVGIAANSDGTPGGISSAIIMAADKFAIVAPNYSGGMTTAPPAGSVPFGVENLPSGGSRIYMNAGVRIRGGLDVTATYGSTEWANEAEFTFYMTNSHGWAGSYSGMSPSKAAATGNSAGRLYAGHYGVAKGTSAISIGLLGEARGQGGNLNSGVVGVATGGSNSYGGVFSGQSADLALIGSGVFLWGNTVVPKPNGSATSFLNGLGQWVTPTSSGVTTFNGRAGPVTLASADVTTALGYTPPTATSVSNEINANNANYIAPNYALKTHTHSSAPYATDAGSLGGVTASNYFRFTGSTAVSGKTLAGYAQVLVGGGYYWIPIYQ